MIRKFIFIKNVGRYKNSASTPNPQLTKNVFATTERYLGCKQKLRSAVNDRLGIEPDAD